MIPTWNAWEHLDRCLQSLHSTLRWGDQVVVVDNGSSDGTADGLDSYPWVEVVRNRENRGFGRACNQGAACARGEVVVFLNSDTVVPQGWLEELLAPFGQGDVGAAGPRSDNVSGVQHAEGVPYASDDPSVFDEFAQGWREGHRGQVTDVLRLIGFCLAVRATTFTELGGFDERYGIGGFEDDDLCRRVRERGLRLVIAHGSFVHHHGHATFDANDVDWRLQQTQNRALFEEKWGSDALRHVVTVSACLIVKDEEQMLPECLESLRDIVDEIVVYDTGSSDRTVELARAAGAVVVEGCWEDSFAKARNAALAHASGEWVLSIDADERLQAHPHTMRGQLADAQSDVEAYLVAIENLHGAGNPRSVHTAVRVFRRRAVTWRHRLHEQVVALDDGSRPLRTAYLSGARLIHHGYAAEVFDVRHKSERNLELARAALADDEQSYPYALMNYGRALESAGRSEEAVGCLIEAAEATEDPITRRLATTNLVYILGRIGRFDEALTQIHQLRRLSRSQVAADIAEGRTRLAMGQPVEGLAILARIPARGRDDDGMEYAPHMVASIRGEALASLGRYGEAADVVLDAVRSDGVLEADLGELVRWLVSADRSPAEITAALSVEDLVPMLGRVLRQPPMLADVLLSGAWERFPDRLEPLAAAARVGPRLPVARALWWSARLRSKGLASACPLVAIAQSPDIDPTVRVRASAAAFGSFGDARVVPEVRSVLGAVDPAVRSSLHDEIARLAPGLPAVLDGAPWPAPSPGPIERPDRGGSRAAAPESTPAPTPPAVRVRGRMRGERLPGSGVARTTRRGGLNIVGPFEGSSEESDVARRLSTALLAGGGRISTVSYHRDGRDTGAPSAHPDAGDFPFDVNLLVVPPDQMADFVLDNGPGSFEGRYVIGAWQWDLDRASASMSDAGRMVHEMWVPTASSAAIVKTVHAGPVLVVPTPVGDPPPSLDRTSVGMPSGFVFTTTVDYDRDGERQNPMGVLRAYLAEFQPGEAQLVVDTSRADRYPAEHDELLDAAQGRPDVTILDRAERTQDERDAVIALSDCFVSLHRADGSLTPVTKAMCWGTPTVVTASPAARELQSSIDTRLVRADQVAVPDHKYSYPAGAHWASPCLDDASAAMRQVMVNTVETEVKVRRAQKAARRRFSPSAVSRLVRNRLTSLDAQRYPDRVTGRRPA